MGDLHGRRLTYVNEGASRQMVRRDLRHRPPPIDPGCRRRRAVSPSPPSATPAADRSTSSAPPERAPSAAAESRTNPVAGISDASPSTPPLPGTSSPAQQAKTEM